MERSSSVMHAFLVIGKNMEKVDEIVRHKVNEIGRRRIDYKIEGIGEVRELRKYLKLKVTEPTTYVINDFDKISVEAQNAFLKTVEEPQEKLFFVLSAGNEEEVLPTIKSRCLIIQSIEKIEVSKKIIERADDFIYKSGVEKMMTVATVKAREEAVKFMTELIIGGRELMKSKKINAVFFEEAQLTMNNLERNGNVALQMTNFVVNIS